jgi:hypothetical protein
VLRRLLIGLFALGLVPLILSEVSVIVPALLLGANQVHDVRRIQGPARLIAEVNWLRTTIAHVLGGLAVAAGAIVGRSTSGRPAARTELVLELQRRGQSPNASRRITVSGRLRYALTRSGRSRTGTRASNCVA